MRRQRSTEVSTVKKPVTSAQQGKIAGLAVVVMAAGSEQFVPVPLSPKATAI